MVELSALIQQCRQERAAFIKSGEQRSPACVELFRRAFAGDEAAWEVIFLQVFKVEIQRWVEAAARVRKLNATDVEEAIQETHLAFWRYAPKAPTLLQSGDLDPIIAYLKKCVMSAVTTVARRLPPPDELALADLAGEEDEAQPADATPGRKWKNPTQRSSTEEWENVHEIVEELKKVLQTDLERRLAQECLLNGTPPREFLADYPQLLPGDTDAQKLANLNQALKRIRLRAEKSPTFQNLQSARRKSSGAAFLMYNVSAVAESGEAMMPGSETCAFDEATLLEYVQGKASVELCAAIERSPPCVEAARRFADEVELLTPLLRLTLCPDVDTLIDYYAKQLPGAQQLVIHNHVQRCRQCQAEVDMYAAIDAVALEAGPSLMRRVIEALFLPPTLSAAPTRGGGLVYRTQIRTPQLDILIRSSVASGKPRRWTVRIDVRTDEGVRFTDVEQILLQNLDEVNVDPIAAAREEDGTFVVRGLEAGRYSLRVLTAEEEIFVRELMVGESA